MHLVQGPWIAAGFNNNLWEVTLPQIARANSTVRHAAIGIGALSKWYSQSKHESLRSASLPLFFTAEEDSHYFHAVGHYCHAMKLQSQQSSVQDAVFSSILFLCFEALRGNRKAALDHINHSMAMLLALLTDPDSSPKVSSLGPNPKPLLAVLSDIFTTLASQSRFVLRGRLGRSQVLPNFTQGLKDRKHTVESFFILASELHPKPASNGEIPAVFKTLDEFEDYWGVAQRSRFEIGPLMLDVIKDSGIMSSGDQEAIKRFWHSLTGDPRIMEFCEASTREMETLEAAFMPLFNRSIMSDPTSPEYLRAIHLRLHYLSVYAFENPTQYYNAELLHAQTSLFREYLSLAEIALRTARDALKNPAGQLSLQCGVACHLLLVAFFCRDPLVRDEAIWMLKDYPAQDGIWNVRSLYVLALRNRVVERLNATEGTTEEQWRRLWRREYLFEDGGDRIVFCFLDKDQVSGEWVLVEETADVEGNLEDVQWQRRPPTSSGRLLMGDLAPLWENSY